MQEYDAIIIGAGQGGGPLSSALAQAGKRVAIIERAHAGGTCVKRSWTLHQRRPPAHCRPSASPASRYHHYP